LAAGARTVVASHWPVGPATAELMDGFYRALAAGNRPAAALRAAKLRMRSAPGRAHPFYWASFALVAGG
ncbi:MAG: CHAT domain-containing protein, partial [Gemmatimonadota bacterium]